MRAVAKPTPDLAAAARLSASLPYYNAMMRTTCVATLLEGGHATNALPQMASANVNCRILPGVSPASVKDEARGGAGGSEDRGRVRRRGARRASRRRCGRTSWTLVESLTKQMYPGVASCR